MFSYTKFQIEINICHVTFIRHNIYSELSHTRLDQTNVENLRSNFGASTPVEKNKQKKIMVIAKLFALHANAKNGNGKGCLVILFTED